MVDRMIPESLDPGESSSMANGTASDRNDDG